MLCDVFLCLFCDAYCPDLLLSITSVKSWSRRGGAHWVVIKITIFHLFIFPLPAMCVCAHAARVCVC